ncbi:phage terminase small subunit P27 family [Clostridium celatum]|uniref:Phage terminase, small subunit, P27 family n=1 Tax=Clostridium celatum DSM 1785 TaxID=545697 RepID=L1QF05_9CLOT|nr:phage terminase small subunit P27 family [Clostridium celatum]EKY26563.1 phage terminase, small subunit, P27 family [Clostridium celatum DSM 1785]
MARPSKPVNLQTCHLTQEERQARQEAEARLKGGSDKVKPPSYLSKEQKKIFKYIVKEMEASGVLANLDIYILSTVVIAIDRMQVIDKMVNSNPELLVERKLLGTRKDAESAFFRACTELGLSPTARSKIANINVQAQVNADDPVLKALRDDD